jgi:hypothetical protein
MIEAEKHFFMAMPPFNPAGTRICPLGCGDK